MLGKWSVILLSLTAATIIGCRKVPTAERGTATPPPNVVLPSSEQRWNEALLKRVLAAYEWEPTGERAVDVWTAFAAIDSQLAKLKEEVSRKAGGARAEAEIQRIELQRVRNEQMERFAKAQARIRYAQVAFNNLAASINQREGIRAAASMITQGHTAEAGEWKRRGLRGMHSGLQMR